MKKLITGILLILMVCAYAAGEDATLLAISGIRYNKKYVSQWEAEDIENVIFRQFAFNDRLKVVSSDDLNSVLGGLGIKTDVEIDGDVASKVGAVSATNFIVIPFLEKNKGVLHLSMVMYNANSGRKEGNYTLNLDDEYNMEWDILSAVNYLIEKIFYIDRFVAIRSVATHRNTRPSYMFVSAVIGYSYPVTTFYPVMNVNVSSDLVFLRSGGLEFPISMEIFHQPFTAPVSSLFRYDIYSTGISAKMGIGIPLSHSLMVNIEAGPGYSFDVFSDTGEGTVQAGWDPFLDTSAEFRFLIAGALGISFKTSYKLIFFWNYPTSVLQFSGGIGLKL